MKILIGALISILATNNFDEHELHAIWNPVLPINQETKIQNLGSNIHTGRDV